MLKKVIKGKQTNLQLPGTSSQPPVTYLLRLPKSICCPQEMLFGNSSFSLELYAVWEIINYYILSVT